MLSLTIQHKIYLTKQERYALHDGKDISVTGVSIPVWFSKNTTSEPAREIFCKYYLKNTKIETPIRILKDGYEIVLPNRKGFKPEISNEEWREMVRAGTIRENYYDKCVSRVSSENLLDIDDGGSKYLFYREYNEVVKNGTTTKIGHFVSIEG